MKTSHLMIILCTLCLSVGSITQQICAAPLDDLYNTLYSRIPGYILHGPIQDVINTETTTMTTAIEERQKVEKEIANATKNLIGKQKAQLLIKKTWSWLSKKMGLYKPDIDEIRPNEDFMAKLKTITHNKNIRTHLKKLQEIQQKIKAHYDVINSFESFKQSNSELYNFIKNNKKTLKHIILKKGYQTPHEEKIARTFIELANDQNNRLVNDINNALEKNISLEELHNKYPQLNLDNNKIINDLSKQLGVYEPWYMKPINIVKDYVYKPTKRFTFSWLGKPWGTLYQEHPDATVAVTTATTMALITLLAYKIYKQYKQIPAQRPQQAAQQQNAQNAQAAPGNNNINAGVNVQVIVNQQQQQALPNNGQPAVAAQPQVAARPNNNIGRWGRIRQFLGNAFTTITPPAVLAVPLIGAISYGVGK